jgi:hypothetical protein
VVLITVIPFLQLTLLPSCVGEGAVKQVLPYNIGKGFDLHTLKLCISALKEDMATPVLQASNGQCY